MPKSRGRKKNKKKKVSSPKKNISKKSKVTIREFDGMELKLDGENISLKNTRNEEEQIDFLNKIKENRPNLLLRINKFINRIEEIFKKYDNIQLLGYLAYNFYLNHDNTEDDGMAEVSLEYANSFSTAIKDNPDTKPDLKILWELKELLYNVRLAYNAYIGSEITDTESSPEENHLRFKAILEALHTRGNGYLNHIHEVYLELFSKHDDFFSDHYGFETKDLLDAFSQFEQSYYCRMKLPNGMPHPESFKRFDEWQKMNGIGLIRSDDLRPMINFLSDNPDFVSVENRPHGYRVDNPSTFKDLYKVRFRKELHKKIADLVSIEFGENEDFLNPKFKGLPLNDSLVTTNPIIKYDGDYYLFAFNIFTRYLFDITESLIKKADSKYYKKKFLGNKYSKSRDNYLENKTADLFSNFLNKSDSYLNYKYKPGQKDENGNIIETEVDLLLSTEHANYIIEIKAGGLSAPSKRGAIKSLTSQLSETVGYGSYQSYRAFKYIMENDDNEFYNEDGDTINIDNSKKTFRIVITLEQLTTYISNLYELQQIGILDPEVHPAWTCSLFDILIFSEILDNEADFIDYLEQRLSILSNPKFIVNDEIDLLGLFLDNSKIIDEKKYENYTTVMINKSSQDIDQYFEKGGVKPTKKGS